MKFPELQSKLNKETRELSEDFKAILNEKQKPLFIAYCNKRSMCEYEMINTYFKYFYNLIMKEIDEVDMVDHKRFCPVYHLIKNIDVDAE
jgi:predicted site-specific integrase-resolvase